MSDSVGPGIHALTAKTYHADPCEKPSLSASIAKILCNSSPLHAWTAHPRLNPDYQPEETEKFDIGTAAHALLLHDEFALEVIDAPDWRTNAAQEARDEARRTGRLPLLAKHWDAVQAMVAAANSQLDGIKANPRPFKDGQAERALVWDDDGVLCRARLDWLSNDRAAIDDYKTTSRSANPESWSRSLFSMGYDLQAAFYLRGLAKIVGPLLGGMADFRFVVQETSPPFALSVSGLTPSALELADAKVEYAIGKWRECVSRGIWPGYPLDICYAEPPGWAEVQWLEKEGREAA